ncbi:MAG: hypothetical protein JWQ38_3752 [Flavipsychrobacter sp.]|nr:hypothetical protein [Flavipsychrobacter sp.]
MKTTIQFAGTKLLFLFVCLLSGFYSLAQEEGTSQTSSTSSHSSTTVAPADAAMWYTNPIVWVAGVAVLLLIIIFAARSGKGKVSNSEVSRTTTTTTTIKED